MDVVRVDHVLEELVRKQLLVGLLNPRQIKRDRSMKSYLLMTASCADGASDGETAH